MRSVSPQQIYQPLNKDRKEIRYLRVSGPRNNGRGLVRATLHTTFLDPDTETSDYEAISYCWAEVPGETYLMINGMIWKAPASAVKVLSRFRPSKETSFRNLWVDAICINQSDIEERAHQVQLMGDVYRQCQRALIWLGGYDPSVDKALSSLQLITDDFRDRTKGYETVEESFRGGAWRMDEKNDVSYSAALLKAGLDENSLHALVRRPWFSRLWVCMVSLEITFRGPDPNSARSYKKSASRRTQNAGAAKPELTGETSATPSNGCTTSTTASSISATTCQHRTWPSSLAGISSRSKTNFPTLIRSGSSSCLQVDFLLLNRWTECSEFLA